MEREVKDAPGTSRLGLLLAMAICAVGVITGAVAAAFGAPIWLTSVTIPIGLMLLGLYSLIVYTPQVSVSRKLDAAQGARDRSERAFNKALEHLQAGDVADALGSCRIIVGSLDGTTPAETVDSFFDAVAEAWGCPAEQLVPQPHFG